MIRLAVVILIAAAIIGLTLRHLYGLAMALGLIVGAAMFLLGTAAGGGLGNARRFDRKPADVGTRIGLCLAVMGLAVQGLRADVYSPPSYRLFFTGFQYLGALIGIVLAFRYRHAGKDITKS